MNLGAGNASLSMPCISSIFAMWRDALGPRYMWVTVIGSLRLNECGK